MGDPAQIRALAFVPVFGVTAVRAGDKWGLVDVIGREAIEARFDEVSQFDRGISWSRTGGEWCAIDRRGKRISALPCQTTKPINAQDGWSIRL